MSESMLCASISVALISLASLLLLFAIAQIFYQSPWSFSVFIRAFVNFSIETLAKTNEKLLTKSSPKRHNL